MIRTEPRIRGACFWLQDGARCTGPVRSSSQTAIRVVGLQSLANLCHVFFFACCFMVGVKPRQWRRLNFYPDPTPPLAVDAIINMIRKTNGHRGKPQRPNEALRVVPRHPSSLATDQKSERFAISRVPQTPHQGCGQTSCFARSASVQRGNQAQKGRRPDDPFMDQGHRCAIFLHASAFFFQVSHLFLSFPILPVTRFGIADLRSSTGFPYARHHLAPTVCVRAVSPAYRLLDFCPDYVQTHMRLVSFAIHYFF